MNMMTVRHVRPLCEVLFGSGRKESELDTDLQHSVNLLKNTAAKYSNMPLVEFVGDHHSHVFIKRMWRAAYVVNAFERAERYGAPKFRGKDFSKMRSSVLISRSCKVDAHYFAWPVVCQAYAERMEDDIRRRWKHRLDLRVRAYLAYHVAYALYQWNAVIGGNERDRHGLLDIVESYFDLILPDPDYTDARDPEVRSVWYDAKYMKRCVNTEKEWAERVAELAQKEERLLWYVSSSDASRGTLDDLLDETLGDIATVLESRQRDRLPVPDDDDRVLDCGTYLYPDGIAMSDDPYASVRRQLRAVDGCKFGNRIRVNAKNCMDCDRRRPIMCLEFEFLKKKGLTGCLKKGVAEITKMSVMSDFIILLKAMERDVPVEMPRNWTRNYQSGSAGVVPVHRILKDALIESMKDPNGYWTGYAKIRSELLKPIFGN